MKLPPMQLKDYFEARKREQLAFHRLGVARMEYLSYERQATSDVALARELADKAVRDGLSALGLNPDDPIRHFRVMEDGSVMELIAGNYAQVRSE